MECMAIYGETLEWRGSYIRFRCWVVERRRRTNQVAALGLGTVPEADAAVRAAAE